MTEEFHSPEIKLSHYPRRSEPWSSMLRFDVYGRLVGVECSAGHWIAFYLGDDGKHRVAHDLAIPQWIDEARLAEYLADLCHEWATPRHAEVRRLDR